jgi:MYXO-CTERM domain-containing protein
MGSKVFAVAVVLAPLAWSGAAFAQGVCASVDQADLLLCEDWEDPLWFDVTGAPGSWIDHGGTGTCRGCGSHWTQRYGPGSCGWLDGEPANPALGVTCDLSQGGQACANAALMPNDEYQAPSSNTWGPEPTPPAGADPPSYACLKPILNAADIDSENLGLTGPADLPFGGVVAFRVPQGNGASTWPTGNEIDRATAGILGRTSWPPVTEIGVTMAVAYSSNTGDSGIWNAPWKHDQYTGDANENALEMWFSGNTGTGGPDQLPFSPFRFAEPGCDAALAAATVVAGNFACDNGVSLQYSPEPDAYTQSVDWPWGTWGCVRAYQRGMNTGDMELYIKFQGPNDDAERTLIHLTGFDGTTLSNQNYSNFAWNNYANVNQATGSMTSAPMYRLEDNVVIVSNREPLTCAEIGFGPGGPTTGAGGSTASGAGGGATSGAGVGAGASADDSSASGCGCQTIGSTQPRAWLLFLALAAACARRRRADVVVIGLLRAAPRAAQARTPRPRIARVGGLRSVIGS